MASLAADSSRVWRSPRSPRLFDDEAGDADAETPRPLLEDEEAAALSREGELGMARSHWGQHKSAALTSIFKV